MENFLMRVLENIPEDKPMSLLQLTRKSGLDHRTIRKYLETIMTIQEGKKVVKAHIGMRIVVRKEAHPVESPGLFENPNVDEDDKRSSGQTYLNQYNH